MKKGNQYRIDQITKELTSHSLTNDIKVDLDRFVNDQEPLGSPFDAILYENLWDLYVHAVDNSDQTLEQTIIYNTIENPPHVSYDENEIKALEWCFEHIRLTLYFDQQGMAEYIIGFGHRAQDIISGMITNYDQFLSIWDCIDCFVGGY